MDACQQRAGILCVDESALSSSPGAVVLHCVERQAVL